MGATNNLVPVVSKIFCSPLRTSLIIRKRPRVVSGGGLAVLNCRNNVVFSVDGCGILGANGEIVVKDGDGAPILYIHKKEGMVQALSARGLWKGYLMEFGRPSKSVFSLREPRKLVVSNNVRIWTDTKGHGGHWDYKVEGSFHKKACSVVDRNGNVVAKVGNGEKNGGKDFYHVAVEGGYDQAFVVGVIAVLDNIHGESTTC